MTAPLLVVTACTAALGGVLAVDRLRDRRRLAMRPTVGSISSTAALDGTDPNGSPLAVELAAHGGYTLLAFLSSSCVTCRSLWAAFDADLARRLPRGTAAVIVTEDPADERAAVVRDVAPRRVPVVMSSATWRRFGVTEAPFFVLVEGGSGRLLAADTAADARAVLRLAGAPGRD
jgi:hypothetical protein